MSLKELVGGFCCSFIELSGLLRPPWFQAQHEVKLASCSLQVHIYCTDIRIRSESAFFFFFSGQICEQGIWINLTATAQNKDNQAERKKKVKNRQDYKHEKKYNE